MFKVFRVPYEKNGKVKEGYEIFWCPSAPMHYQDKIPHDGKIYVYRQSAYKHMKKLRDALEKTDKRPVVKKEAA